MHTHTHTRKEGREGGGGRPAGCELGALIHPRRRIDAARFVTRTAPTPTPTPHPRARHIHTTLTPHGPHHKATRQGAWLRGSTRRRLGPRSHYFVFEKHYWSALTRRGRGKRRARRRRPPSSCYPCTPGCGYMARCTRWSATPICLLSQPNTAVERTHQIVRTSGSSAHAAAEQPLSPTARARGA